jgi:hypothetical protein
MHNVKRLMVLFVLSWVGVSNAAIIHATRNDLIDTLGTKITDDYSDPAYVGFMDSATVSAVLGETEISFTTTSVGSTSGVFGVGLDYTNSDNLPFIAHVTFGDNSSQDYNLSSVNTWAFPNIDFFFGITSDTLIKSIHFGTSGGGATSQGYFYIDNLTIGDKGTVPEPSILALMSAGLVGLGYARRRKQPA